MADLTKEELKDKIFNFLQCIVSLRDEVFKNERNQDSNYLNKEIGAYIFSRNFPNLTEDIKEKGTIEDGINIEKLIEKAKNIIEFKVRGVTNPHKFFLALITIKVRSMNLYTYLPFFIERSFEIIQQLAYLFNMPFIPKSVDITEDDICLIFIYYGVMFDDSTSKSLLQKILKDRTISNILNIREKEKLENRVYNYIIKHANPKTKDILHYKVIYKITNYNFAEKVLDSIFSKREKAFIKVSHRLLNTFVECAYKVG